MYIYKLIRIYFMNSNFYILIKYLTARRVISLFLLNILYSLFKLGNCSFIIFMNIFPTFF